MQQIIRRVSHEACVSVCTSVECFNCELIWYIFTRQASGAFSLDVEMLIVKMHDTVCENPSSETAN